MAREKPLTEVGALAERVKELEGDAFHMRSEIRELHKRVQFLEEEVLEFEFDEEGDE